MKRVYYFYSMIAMTLSKKLLQMKNGLSIGNNGNQLVNVLHEESLIKDGMTAEQLEVLAKPYMINERHLQNDELWEDVFCRAEELGYKLKY